MEPITLFGGIAAAGAAAAMTGVGLRLGARLIPLTLQARRDLKTLRNSPQVRLRQLTAEADRTRQHLARPEGRRRDSSIVGFYQDCLRHADGSYTRLYEIRLQPTMLAEESFVERRCDDFARMLCQELPKGTMVQVRYRVAPDPGRVVARMLRERKFAGAHPPAVQILDHELAHHHALCEGGFLRYDVALLAVRVPARHESDAQSRGLTAFLPDFFAHLRHGSAIDALKTAPAHPAFRGIVDRLQAHEIEAWHKAEMVMRRIELECPLELRQFTGRELFEVLYRSHNLSAKIVPNVSIYPGDDIREYLCQDSIESREQYVLHGNVPVAMISMFVPPDGGIYADSIRTLTARADLTFPHTLVTEYIALDPDEVKKDLKKRAHQVEQETKKADGSARRDHDARAALNDLEQVLDHISRSREAIVQCRCYALVYGDPLNPPAEAKRVEEEIERRAEVLESALKRVEGADVKREAPEALHCLYRYTLLGEMSPQPTGREMQEGAHSLAALAPLETAWPGSAFPHTVFGTVSGRQTGLNLWDKSEQSEINSPLIPILGTTGAGKSTLGAVLITGALGAKPGCRVVAVDYKRSLAPLAEVLGARYFTLAPEDKRTINIWDFPELYEGGELPEEMETLILMDAMTLLGVKPDDDRSPVVLTKCIRAVLKNYAKKNGPDKPRKEPTYTNLWTLLENFESANALEVQCARDLASKLKVHLDDPHLNAPTHPDFDRWSPFDVYELDSLHKFSPLKRQVLASRIATRVIRSIGRKNEDGEFTPTLLVFDEAHEYPKEFPGLMRVIGKGARHGRKENVVTLVITHTWDDFDGIHDITATAGVKFIGLQACDITKLAHDARLSDRAVKAIHSIRNANGLHTQWVLVLGSGERQQVEMVQVELSPVQYWIYTTNADERNARSKVMRLTGCTMADAVAWLAGHYPRGLVSEGLLDIDESLLMAMRAEGVTRQPGEAGVR